MQNIIKREFTYFIYALMFFTRIPCPDTGEYKQEYLHKARKYFPVIGWLIGTISVVIFLLSLKIFPINTAVIFSIISTVIATGAFHEDGLADAFDAFGGGFEKHKILEIMKDSRIGSFGVIALIFALLLKYITLCELAKKDIILTVVVMINAHTFSRLMASVTTQTYEYVSSQNTAKSKPIASEKLSAYAMAYSTLLGIFPSLLICLSNLDNIIFAVFPCVYMIRIPIEKYFRKRIGGYTGDCLGTIQQITELAFYIITLALTSEIAIKTAKGITDVL